MNPLQAASTLESACLSIPSGTGSTTSPDYVFACAGGCVPVMFVETSAEKHWECMEWNFRTCLNTIHQAVVKMKESSSTGSGKGTGGKIVLTSSVLALMSFAGYSGRIASFR